MDLQVLKDIAASVAAIFALSAVLAPLVNRLNAIKQLEFGYSNLFTFLAEVTSLGTFLAILVYRNRLHLLPFNFLGWSILLVVAVVSLFVLHTLYDKQQAKDWRHTTIIAGAALTYSAAAALFTAFLTHFGAEYVFFSAVHGAVTTKTNNTQKPGVRVYCVGYEEWKVYTVTNADGRYQFLLTSTEAEKLSEVRLGSSIADDALDFSFIPADEKGFPLEKDLTWPE